MNNLDNGMDKEFLETKWIRVMFDFSSTGIWHQSGSGGSYEDTSLSPGLVDKIDQWVRLCDRHASEQFNIESSILSGNNSPELTLRNEQLKNYEKEHFKLCVLLAIEVKKELPDWTVVVFNDCPDILTLPTDETHNSEIMADFQF